MIGLRNGLNTIFGVIGQLLVAVGIAKLSPYSSDLSLTVGVGWGLTLLKHSPERYLRDPVAFSPPYTIVVAIAAAVASGFLYRLGTYESLASRTLVCFGIIGTAAAAISSIWTCVIVLTGLVNKLKPSQIAEHS
jgi:hypothetical protein